MTWFDHAKFGLAARIFAILLLALGVEFCMSTLVYERASNVTTRAEHAHRVGEHLVVAHRLMSDQPLAGRALLSKELSSSRFQIRWLPSKIEPPRPHTAALPRIDEQIIQWEPELAQASLRTHIKPGNHGWVQGDLRLEDGSWMEFKAAGVITSNRLSVARMTSALAPALILALLAGFMLHKTLRPMRSLAMAAEQIGHGGRPVLREEGPGEVRRVVRAFNDMQLRIDRLISDRTQALVGVSHDLRTPLARLALRLDAISDKKVRREVERDVQEMSSMVSSLLAFLSGAEDPEPQIRTDVAVLAASAIDDLQDRGVKATYSGEKHADAMVRPIALTRALTNLIDNALHYGVGPIQVRVSREDGHIVIAVEDRGPGIPPEDLQRVRQPFGRLDPARPRDTQGFGLGLAIVDQILDRENGVLRLINRPEGGLSAQIHIPDALQQ